MNVFVLFSLPPPSLERGGKPNGRSRGTESRMGSSSGGAGRSEAVRDQVRKVVMFLLFPSCSVSFSFGPLWSKVEI